MELMTSTQKKMLYDTYDTIEVENRLIRMRAWQNQFGTTRTMHMEERIEGRIGVSMQKLFRLYHFVVNTSPIRYDFCVAAQAIRDKV